MGSLQGSRVKALHLVAAADTHGSFPGPVTDGFKFGIPMLKGSGDRQIVAGKVDSECFQGRGNEVVRVFYANNSECGREGGQNTGSNISLRIELTEERQTPSAPVRTTSKGVSFLRSATTFSYSGITRSCRYEQSRSTVRSSITGVSRRVCMYSLPRTRPITSRTNSSEPITNPSTQ